MLQLKYLKLLISILLLAMAQVGIAQGTDTMPNLQPTEQECLDSVQRARAEPPQVVDTNRGDKYYKFQWYLNGTAHGRFSSILNENSTTRSIHINVEKAWERGYRGQGTYIAIVDRGIDPNHPELKPNLAAECSYDYDIFANTVALVFSPDHGFQVAGIAAARGYNDIGVRGVAPLAKFFVLNDRGATQNRIDAMVRNSTITAVSNNSYGSFSFVSDTAHMMQFRAIETGLRNGFYGNGTVYVWSAGNSGAGGDNSNYDIYKNYHAVVSVCGVGYRGRNNRFSEPGANLWLCAADMDTDFDYELFVITTKGRHTYVDDGGTKNNEEDDTYYNHRGGGTSLSAAMVSGVVALMRQANPNLGWRDVKLILAASAAHNDPEDRDWQSTGIRYGAFDGDTDNRYRFNHKYGFGLVDADNAVSMAEHWINLPPQATAAEAQKHFNANVNGTRIESSLSVQSDIDFIEHVEATINFRIDKIANLSIELISPAGTTSVLAASAVRSGITKGYNGAWRFGSSKHLGEDPSGTWQLIVRNAVDRMVTLRNWKLKIRGYEVQLNAVASDDLSYLKGKTRLQLPLAGAHWKQALSPNDFRLSNAPPGLRIEEVVRATTTHAELILDLRADLADADYLFQVQATTRTVSNLSGALLSNDLKIARIAVTEATIPDGRVGSNYHFVASDILTSPMPLSYNITLLDEMQNELQPDEIGFSIEGATLRGTPTRAGRYQMRITATRADGIRREETFAFAVDPHTIQTQIRVFLEGLLR